MFICLLLEIKNRILSEYKNYKKLHYKNKIVKITNVYSCKDANYNVIVYTGFYDSMIKYTCTIIRKKRLMINKI